MADRVYDVDANDCVILTFDAADQNPHGHDRGCYCPLCYGVYYPHGSPNLNQRERIEAACLAGYNTRDLTELALRNLGAPETARHARAAAGDAATAAHHREKLLQYGDDLPVMATKEHEPLRATCWEDWVAIE